MIGRRPLLVSAAAALALPAWAQPEPDASRVRAEVERIVTAFLLEAGAAAGGLQRPRVFVEFTPQLSWAEWPSNELHTATWSQTPPPLQEAIASLLGDDAPMSPEAFFYEVFNVFLIAHEMAHLADLANRRPDSNDTLYDSEVRANRAAVAFWLTQPDGEARLQRLMSAVETIKSRLPSPVPPDEDPELYFEANYEMLGTSFEAYGWYQFHMFLDAWGGRGQKSLGEILSEGL